MNPGTASEWAIVAISLVLIGGILTAGQLGVAERGTVLASIFAALAYIAWRHRRRRNGDDE